MLARSASRVVGSGIALAIASSSANIALPQEIQGDRLNLNGRDYPVAWQQWRDNQNQLRIGISDGGLANRFGVLLGDTTDPFQQPVAWFQPQFSPLAVRFSPNGMYRYLDITPWIEQYQWQVQPQGNTLQISTPPAQILSWRQGRQPWGDRWVFELDRPTPWQVNRLTFSRTGLTPRDLSLTIEATGQLATIPNVKITATPNRTVLETQIPSTARPVASMLLNPPRLVIDFRRDAPPPRTIQWAPGLRWQQQTVTLGSRQFPVDLLIINPQQPGLRLRPLGMTPTTLVGLATVPELAQRWQAAAAINAGFFNRDRQAPLGAIRSEGNWLSGPILNRGAIGWDDRGQMVVGRLSLQQRVRTPAGTVPIVTFNSGYVQAGLALYTPSWGASYQGKTGSEVVITVRNQQVVGQQPIHNNQAIPIPADGFLLVARNFNSALANFPPGASVQLETTAVPAVFNSLPNIVGAGPLLVDQGRVVLNAALEQFGAGLDAQAAPRSAMGNRSDGSIVWVTTHNRIGGMGPTLAEWAQIVRQLGLINAVNLDGGSSTALYIGGVLVDRHSVTTTRVNNAIGVFWQPTP
ncbi:phosphodiester glycosidase family protein [Thermosynechococcus sp. TG252]|uniref:phosphodiester glycosidase family protein n=1 Tax=Thermosynechococcus sp. TG252 TaxID=3074097 RepID=UPI002854C0F8|nr:phosphodiester glycosidase family protein [Thermosynechococcus sp. TG252]MDR7992124.1 phosphodiester glycosidase family protein [Thermosynechococcus sp. TG252]